MVQEAQNRCRPKWKTYPCGYYGDSKHNCRCTPLQIQNYRNKISGPLLDRIDIHIEVPSVHYQELASTGTGEPSAAIRARVIDLAVIEMLKQFADRAVQTRFA